jgi:hypothetical protein
MLVIHPTTEIDCPIEIAFDLARSIDLYEESTSQTGEIAVAGRVSGLVNSLFF